MNDKAGIWVLVGIFILLIFGMIFWMFSGKMVNWSESYYYRSHHPYGTQFLHKLLVKKYDKKNYKLLDRSFDEQLKKLDEGTKYDYIKLGAFKTYDSLAMDAILEFASKGNNVFIANAHENYLLLDSLFQYVDTFEVEEDSIYFEEEEYVEDDEYEYDYEDYDDYSELDVDEYEEDEEFFFEEDYYYDWTYAIDRLYYNKHGGRSSEIMFINDKIENDSIFPFYYFYENDTLTHSWNYFNLEYLLQLNAVEMSIVSKGDSNNVVMLDISFGDGHIYFHHNPLVFTNVQLLSERSLEYAEQVFTHLDGEVLLWDNYRRKESGFDWGGNYTDDKSNSPLSFFLGHKALRWSIYLSLIAGMLFVLFKAKRKQQYIPVVEPNVNTSLEYAEMMGQLYFKEQNHHFIAMQQWKKFIDHLREHYFIIVKENDSQWVKKAAEKTSLPESRLNGIYIAYQKTKAKNISQHDLMNFYNKLQYFYSNCK